MSSLISVAYGIPLIATPAIVSPSAFAFSDSSRMMSVIAAARNPIRFPNTPTDRQPIFTSFGGSPPFTPRVRSHVTVSGDRWSSSPISFSLSPFSLYSAAFFTRASMLFMVAPGPPSRGRYKKCAARSVRAERSNGTTSSKGRAPGHGLRAGSGLRRGGNRARRPLDHRERRRHDGRDDGGHDGLDGPRRPPLPLRGRPARRGGRGPLAIRADAGSGRTATASAVRPRGASRAPARGLPAGRK